MCSKWYARRQLEKRRAWSRNANAAKERKRLARTSEAIEIGKIEFNGKMFGGQHLIRCMARDGEDCLLLEIDGDAASARTWRGLMRMICKRIFKTVTEE